MTVTVEIPASLSARFEAHARAENQDLAQLAQTLFTAALYDEYDEDGDTPLPPLPAILTEPFADDIRKGGEDLVAGRVVDGATAFALLRRRIERK